MCQITLNLHCHFHFINFCYSTKVSSTACIERYFRTAMCQLMRGDVIAVLNHIHGRQVSYKTGVMTCRNNVDGVSLGDTLANMNKDDFRSDSTSPSLQTFVKGVSTCCKALGHTPEAAKFARRECFALSAYFGLNSLFLTVTPCDECSFRVRLYTEPGNWVSEQVSLCTNTS